MTCRRRAGFTLTEILVVIGIIGVLIAVLLPVMSKVRESSKRLNCASNLRQIGQALTAYATENKGQLPRIRWEKDPNAVGLGALIFEPPANATNPFDTSYWNDNNAALFLLVRQARLLPKVFICPSTDDVPDELGGVSAAERSNFSTNKAGPDGVRTRSYTYSRLYPSPQGVAGGFTNLLQTMKPDFALVADYGLPVCETSTMNWQEKDKPGNSVNHNQVGQNVLYADSHVAWQTTNRCGSANDNIYKGGAGASCQDELNARATDSVMEER